jgi:hypothetical protein
MRYNSLKVTAARSVIDREGIVGMGLLGGFEVADRLVVIEIVEVVETFAGVGIGIGPGRNPGAPGSAAAYTTGRMQQKRTTEAPKKSSR